jgi:hypothetical protein
MQTLKDPTASTTEATAMASAGASVSASANDANVGRAFEELRPAMFALAYRITGSRTKAVVELQRRHTKYFTPEYVGHPALKMGSRPLVRSRVEEGLLVARGVVPSPSSFPDSDADFGRCLSKG